MGDYEAESQKLHERARAFVTAFAQGSPMPESFDALAVAIAQLQSRTVAGYARYLTARAVDASKLTRASDLPAVPTDAFKYARVSAFSEALTPHTFRTSGTTVGDRGAHPFRTTVTYDRGATSFGRHALLHSAARQHVLVVGPSPTELPDSSLTHMFGKFVETFSRSLPQHYFVAGDQIDSTALAQAIERSRAERMPVLLLGTSFAFVHLLDQMGTQRSPLPAGSCVVHTGGYKGKSRELDPVELTQWIARTFDVPAEWITREYGMTELSSQFYATPKLFGPDVFAEPPWARVIPVDPETLIPVPEGEVGIARIEDLLNVDSAVVIQTQDRIRRERGGFVLLGRLPGAPPRGCSLAIDEILGR